MTPYHLQRHIDLWKLREGLKEYFRLLADGARTETEMPHYAERREPAQTREALLT